MIRKRFLAQFFSFITLLCVMLNGFLFLLLNDFSAMSRGSVFEMAISSFIGLVLGAFLCPVFLPLPDKLNNKKKSLQSSIMFILIVILPNIILRSLGVELWINSSFVRSVIAFFSGILYPLAYGLFFLSFLKNRLPKDSHINNTGMYCPLFFALTLAISLVVRNLSFSLLESSGFTSDPLRLISPMFTVIFWIIISMGVCAITCLILLNKGEKEKVPAEKTTSSIHSSTAPRPLSSSINISFILRIISIAAVFKTLNAAMEWQLHSFISYPQFTYQPFYLLAALVISILGFLSGRSLSGFLKWFLPVTIIFLIILPSLMLFDEYPGFLLLLNTLVLILHSSIWVVFTVVLVESYISISSSKQIFSGFWFYGIAVAVHFTNIFTFISPALFGLLPSDTKQTTLIMGISSALFMLLSFRLLFPKTRQKDLVPKPVNEQKTNEKGIFVKTRQISRFILFNDISHIEVIGHKVHFFLLNGEEIIISSTFQDILPKLLSDSRFGQCHRSFVVNMDEISGLDGNICSMNKGQKIPISRTYADFKKHFMQFRGRVVQNN